MSPWFWHYFYSDTSDPRLFVPRRDGHGRTVNWAHPKAAVGLMNVMFAFAYGALLVATATHAAYARENLRIIALLPSVSLFTAAVLHLNFTGVRLNLETFKLSAFGMLFGFAGLVMTSLACVPVALAVGREALNASGKLDWRWWLYIALAFAVCLTGAKILGVRLLTRIFGEPSDVMRAAQYGLAIGFGCAVMQTTIYGWTNIIHEVETAGITLGIWEGASYTMFHLYAAAFIAIALAARLRWLILFIVFAELVMDFTMALRFANPNGAPIHLEKNSIAAQIVFSGIAVAAWLGFIAARFYLSKRTGSNYTSLEVKNKK